jgi:hypothetical protein
MVTLARIVWPAVTGIGLGVGVAPGFRMVVSVVEVKGTAAVAAWTQAAGETVYGAGVIVKAPADAGLIQKASVVETTPIVPVWLEVIVPDNRTLTVPGPVRLSPAAQMFCWQSPAPGAVVRD